MLENEYYKKDNFFIIIWLIAGFYTIFFIFYANNAWFYQDDFTFLYANIHKIDWSHLWTFENFGRFVTRDLYWYYLYSFFGSNSSMYFIFNLFLLVFNSILIFNLFRKLEIKDRYFNLSYKFEKEVFNAQDLIILLKYDNTHIPDISELDQRRFSGFIKKIIIQ